MSGPDAAPEVPTGKEFYEALDAGTLHPEARAIADQITRADDEQGRWSSLYENAYRGALAGIWYAGNMDELADAVRTFAKVAAELDDGATHLTCTEVAGIRAVLLTGGHADAAARLLEAHAWGDEDPEDCQHERYHALHWSSSPELLMKSKVGCCEEA